LHTPGSQQKTVRSNKLKAADSDQLKIADNFNSLRRRTTEPKVMTVALEISALRPCLSGRSDYRRIRLSIAI
jgi:hypothetical protein